jgi:anti-sigma regulatory factor (Ser/Thr protein kinase)
LLKQKGAASLGRPFPYSQELPSQVQLRRTKARCGQQPPDDPIGHMKVREEKGLRPGGLGILMTMSLVDELLYNEAQNEVVFIKYLD